MSAIIHWSIPLVAGFCLVTGGFMIRDGKSILGAFVIAGMVFVLLLWFYAPKSPKPLELKQASSGPVVLSEAPLRVLLGSSQGIDPMADAEVKWSQSDISHFYPAWGAPETRWRVKCERGKKPVIEREVGNDQWRAE